MSLTVVDPPQRTPAPTQGSIPLPENKLYYPALNGLRGVAVLAVFWEHYMNYHPALHWGWAAVDVFFVLSGFLITGILYDTCNTESRYQIFYMRRTLRIFPLFYGVLLALLVLTPFLHFQWTWVHLTYPFYVVNYVPVLYVAGFLKQGVQIQFLDLNSSMHVYLGHFWSLCVEEQFYLIWPMVVYTVKDRIKLRTICIAGVILAPLARLAVALLVPQSYLDAGILHTFMPLRVDALLIGGLVALMLRGPREERDAIERTGKPVLLTCLGGFAAFEILYRVIEHRTYVPDLFGLPMGTWGLSFLSIFSIAIILRAIEPGSRIYKVLNNPILRFFGTISYSFYVLHDIPHMFYAAVFHRIFGTFHHDGYAVALVGLLGTTAIASLSFFFFEKKFLSLKRFYTVGPKLKRAV